jgi:hypothetical protein
MESLPSFIVIVGNEKLIIHTRASFSAQPYIFGEISFLATYSGVVMQRHIETKETKQITCLDTTICINSCNV